MANEGATKPTYKELDGALSHLTSTIISTLCVEICDEDEETTYLLPAEPEPIVCDSIADVVKEFYELANREMLKLEAAEAENLRVRGLLQRTQDELREANALLRNMFDCVFQAPIAIGEIRDFLNKPSVLTVHAGAESADIGKLDRVDENLSQVKGELLDASKFVFTTVETKSIEASAETGGEKAAPHSDEKLREIVWNAQTAELIRQGKAGHNVDCVDGYDLCDAIVEALANFHRTSQNQTVSSGVEGAHEGTTADKSEPEKLNNAQKAEGK